MGLLAKDVNRWIALGTANRAGTAPVAVKVRKKPRSKVSDPAWLAKMRALPGLFIPMRADTPGNGSHGHWTVARAKVKKQRDGVLKALQEAPAMDWVRKTSRAVSLRVTLTRYGWQKMDVPNVGSALKGAIDAIADYCGVDDGDERWDWQFKTEKGRGYGVRIHVEPWR